MPADSRPRLAVTDAGVEPVTVKAVPPSVTVGAGEQVVPVETVHREEPLMPSPVGVPEALVVTKTDVMVGVAPAANVDAVLAVNADATATAIRRFNLDIPYPLQSSCFEFSSVFI